MDHDRVLPQDNEGETGAGGLLEEASAYARAVLESAEAAAGITYCKGVQINELKMSYMTIVRNLKGIFAYYENLS